MFLASPVPLRRSTSLLISQFLNHLTPRPASGAIVQLNVYLFSLFKGDIRVYSHALIHTDFVSNHKCITTIVIIQNPFDPIHCRIVVCDEDFNTMRQFNPVTHKTLKHIINNLNSSYCFLDTAF